MGQKRLRNPDIQRGRNGDSTFELLNLVGFIQPTVYAPH